MSKPNLWMPLYCGDYLGGTMHLTCEGHGAYLLLLIAYWKAGGALPDSDVSLAAICKLTAAEWKRLRPALQPFFEIADGKWVQVRAEQELAKARDHVTAKSAAGRKGANRRWHKDGTGIGCEIELPMAHESHQRDQSDAPSPSPSPPKDSNVLRLAWNGVQRPIPMTAANKLALFQKWLAVQIGPDGWRIIGEAADPESINHEIALAFCKQVASRGGKGWPHTWPTAKVAL